MWFSEDGQTISSPTTGSNRRQQPPVSVGGAEYRHPQQQAHYSIGSNYNAPQADEYIDANDSQGMMSPQQQQQQQQQLPHGHHEEDFLEDGYAPQPQQYVRAHRQHEEHSHSGQQNMAPPQSHHSQEGSSSSSSRLREARERKRAASNSRLGGGRPPRHQPPSAHDPLDVFDQFNGARGSSGGGNSLTALEELLANCSSLSPDFTCPEEDAETLLSLISASGRNNNQQHQHSPDVGRLEDKVLSLESELRMVKQRLERRTEDVEKLKDELEGARGKVSAVEQQSKQTVTVLSQKKDAIRRQLINEESRSAKYQKQNKTLETEVDRLKAKLHTLMGSR